LIQLLTLYQVFLFSFTVLKKFMKCFRGLLCCAIYSDENEYKLLKAAAGFFYGVLLGIGKWSSATLSLSQQMAEVGHWKQRKP
jgi:DNA polymerase III delta subunit